MKITFLVSGSIRSNFSYRALSLARSLVTQGHNVRIIAPKADKYNKFIPESISEINGVKIVQPFQFTTHKLEINLFPYIFGALLALLKEKSDIVYIYKPTPISIVGLCSKFFQSAQIIVDIDDLGSEVMRLEGHAIYLRKLVEWSEHMALKYSDKIIVTSSYLFSLYKREFPYKSILIIPNSVSSDWLTPVIPSSVSKRIVFMGSVNRIDILESLFSVLPNLLKKYPDLELKIIGDGQSLEFFKKKVEIEELSENVSFTGWLEMSEARSQLQFGDIGYCYMPNTVTIQAASNMKVPQYMSRGVVPFVSDVGDLSATVAHGAAGYVCVPDSLDILEQALSSALEDKKRLDKARQARFIAEHDLSCERIAETFEQWVYPKKQNKKKIYFVATTIPADVGGAEIRNFNIVKQLSSKVNNAQVEVFGITDQDPVVVAEKFASTINAKLHMVVDKKRSVFTIIQALVFEWLPPFMTERKLSGLGNVFRKRCEESLPDIVQIEQIDGFYAIRPHIKWLKSKGVKIILDCHNIEFQSFKDSLLIFPLIDRLVGYLLVPHLKMLELEAARYADTVFACSAIDADFFRKINTNTHIVPNGVDCSAFTTFHENDDPTLIFMGGVKYPPNGDAVEFFLKDISPLVKEQVKNVKYLFIGTTQEWLDSKEIQDNSTTPLGFVDDVRPYLSQSSIGICPVRYGSGTRIKIMTYMAAGLAVVSTSKGAEGVEYVNGRDILIANSPEEFASAVTNLSENKEYRKKLAESGRAFIRANFDWDVIGDKLITFY